MLFRSVRKPSPGRAQSTLEGARTKDLAVPAGFDEEDRKLAAVYEGRLAEGTQDLRALEAEVSQLALRRGQRLGPD